VTAILERLCGTSVSSTQVSKAIALLDQTLEAWRQRPLCECPYVVLDARYEKVRQDGQVRDAAILMACGIDLNGRRHLLGASASLGEHEIHWRTFMESLVARGLRGVQLITSDDHTGLKAARKAVFGVCHGSDASLPWRTGRGSTFNKMPVLMCLADPCSQKWPPISGRSSMPRIVHRLNSSCKKPLRSTKELLQNWLPGWKRTFQKG